MKTIRIGTRSSRLALIQTQYVIDAIHGIDPSIQCEIVPMESLGDRKIDTALTSFGRHGVFCDELETAILEGIIDIAVHSSKDMSFELPEGLEILGALRREDPREILITNKNHKGAVQKIGTCSTRRQLQMDQYIPGCQCLSLRGDVETRLNKLASGMYDGIILAAAGIIRLGLQEDPRFQFHYFDVNDFVPAPGQGIIAMEGSINSEWRKLISQITDSIAYRELEIERRIYTMLDFDDYSASSVHVNIHRVDDEHDLQQPYHMALWILFEEDNQLSVKHIKGDMDESLELVKRYFETKLVSHHREVSDADS